MEMFRGTVPRKISVKLCRGKFPRNYAAESFRGTLPRNSSAYFAANWLRFQRVTRHRQKPDGRGPTRQARQ